MRTWTDDEVVTHVGYYLRYAEEIGRPASMVGYHLWRFADSPTEARVRLYGWDRAVSDARAVA
jgi:hypothetical protein